MVKHAAESGNFVRIDMEDSRLPTQTLALYRELRDRGYDNVGIVLQARLRRTLRDIRALADLKPNVRLCKGIYLEPPLIAFQGYEEMRDNFVAALDPLLDGGSYVGIATHDEWLIQRGLRARRRHGAGRVRVPDAARRARAARERLVETGTRLRIYMPFGEHWYAVLAAPAAGEPEDRRLHRRATVGRLHGRCR